MVPLSLGLFGAARGQFLRTSQPLGKSRRYPDKALFGPIGGFRAKPPFAKPPFGLPRLSPTFGQERRKKPLTKRVLRGAENSCFQLAIRSSWLCEN